MYKLISLFDLIHNINYEKINHIKNGVSYVKDILSIHNYELVDIVSSGLQHNFNLVFCNSQGDMYPSSQEIYKDKESSNLMLCTIIHNHLKPNNQYTNMQLFYSYNCKDHYHYYYCKALHCIIDDIGEVSDIKIDVLGVYCATKLKDLFSSFTFLLVKDTK